MADIARAYCQLIEGEPAEPDPWLQRLWLQLARLHAAVAALGAHPEPHGPVAPSDLDARFELYARLRERLGPRDGYPTEFDWNGSLADDLTDIYCELKHGLRLFEESPEQALEIWRHGFRVHWGQHLVDASRHLYHLAARIPDGVGTLGQFDLEARTPRQ